MGWVWQDGVSADQRIYVWRRSSVAAQLVLSVADSLRVVCEHWMQAAFPSQDTTPHSFIHRVGNIQRLNEGAVAFACFGSSLGSEVHYDCCIEPDTRRTAGISPLSDTGPSVRSGRRI